MPSSTQLLTRVETSVAPTHPLPSGHAAARRQPSPPAKKALKRLFAVMEGLKLLTSPSSPSSPVVFSSRSGPAQQQFANRRAENSGGLESFEANDCDLCASREFILCPPCQRKKRAALLRWRGGRQHSPAYPEGRGCVEATTVSTRVSRSADEGKPNREKKFPVTTEMRSARDRPRLCFRVVVVVTAA